MDKSNDNYLKIHQAFYQNDTSPEKRYVEKMCDLYFNEKIPFNEVVHLFKAYEENRNIYDAVGVDFNILTYKELSESVYKITGEYLSRWEMPNVVYHNKSKGITVSLIRNYEEAKSVLCFNTWCVFNSSSYWKMHEDDGDTVYLIRITKGYYSMFYSAFVKRNGDRIYYAYTHHQLTNEKDEEYPSIVEFEQTIGSGAVKALVPRIIKESKTNKNMKKNTIKLNESQLRQIVAESVKKALEEGEEKRQIYVSFRDYLEKRCEAAYKNRLTELGSNDISNRERAFIKEGITLAKSVALDAFSEYIGY
jgi:hypothetical protein